MEVFLHAGLPRTATTVLQSAVFPRLASLHYVGKDATNRALAGRFNPIVVTEDCCRRAKAGDSSAMAALRAFLPSLMHGMKLSLRDRNAGQAAQFAAVWAECIDKAASILDDKPLLYSDEAMSESMSGLMADPGLGDRTPLELLGDAGMMQRVRLSVAVREPLGFLRASYYKTQEFLHKYKSRPFSFDEFIRRQLEIYNRHPSSSRVFLCMPHRLGEHCRSLCPRTTITPYSELVKADDVVGTLLGWKLPGDAPVRLASLPRDNSTWRDPEVNRFILYAPDVPSGMTIEQYAETFPETLRQLGVDDLIEADRRAAPTSKKPS